LLSLDVLGYIRPRLPMADPGLAEELKAWKIVTAQGDGGQTAVIRIRLTKPGRPDVTELATAIVIKWPYDAAAGMPPASVNQQQLSFEEALDPLSPGEDSELVQVSTGMGLKEWVFYARSRETFMARLNELLQGHPRYPIAIEFYDDPQWQVWGEVAEAIQAKAPS
jgi:hypothetical protein